MALSCDPMLKLHIVLRPLAQDAHLSTVSTRTVSAVIPTTSAGQAILSLSHQGNITLLETLERHHQPVESQCRAGFCGACRTRLYHGQVRYLTTPLAFIGDDEILPCCCVPQTDLQIGLYASASAEIEHANTEPSNSDAAARAVIPTA